MTCYGGSDALVYLILVPGREFAVSPAGGPNRAVWTPLGLLRWWHLHSVVIGEPMIMAHLTVVSGRGTMPSVCWVCSGYPQRNRRCGASEQWELPFVGLFLEALLNLSCGFGFGFSFGGLPPGLLSFDLGCFNGLDKGTVFLGSASADLGLFSGFPEDEHEGGVESALFGVPRVSGDDRAGLWITE